MLETYQILLHYDPTMNVPFVCTLASSPISVHLIDVNHDAFSRSGGALTHQPSFPHQPAPAHLDL